MNALTRQTLSVVVPVYNEQAAILEAIGRIEELRKPLHERYGFDLEIVVIDDGSSDETPSILSRLKNIRLLSHEKNQGKGSALRTGFHAAIGSFVAIQDADEEYDPLSILELLQPILENQADAVYGSRYLDNARLYTYDRWVHQFLNALVFLHVWRWISDVETCQKVFRRSLLERMNLRSRTFTIEVELTMKLLRQGARLVELPIPYQRRTWAEGKKIRCRDLLKAIAAIVVYGSRADFFYPRIRQP